MSYKKILTIVLSFFIVGFSYSFAQDSTKSAKTGMKHKMMMMVKAADKNDDGKVFQCPMVCSDQLTDAPAECEKCGMNMKEVTIKQAEQALHSKHEKMMGHRETEAQVDVEAADKNNDGKVFQCPMVCSDQLSDEKGSCEKCGMFLNEISIEKAKEQLHKHGYKVK